MSTAHRSVSQYQTYARCGAAYRLERKLNAPQAPAGWFIQGAAVHEAVEVWERSLRSLPLDDVIDKFDEVWFREIAHYFNKEPDIGRWLCLSRKGPEADLNDRFYRGRDQVARYIEYSVQDPYQPILLSEDESAVEWEFTIDLDGVAVNGVIDLLLGGPDGDVIVQDLKTGSKRPASPFQLGIYRVACEDLGLNVQFGRWFMAKDGEPTKPIWIGNYSREQVTHWFHAMDKAEKAGIYFPNPDDHCKICTVQRYCPVNGPDRDRYFSEESTVG